MQENAHGTGLKAGIQLGALDPFGSDGWIELDGSGFAWRCWMICC